MKKLALREVASLKCHHRGNNVRNNTKVYARKNRTRNRYRSNYYPHCQGTLIG